MIEYDSIQKAMGVDIAVSEEMAKSILLWSRMYMNKAPWLNEDVKSLQLPAAISSAIVRYVTMEKKISISGSVRADYLKRQFKRVDKVLGRYLEYGLAKGGMVAKPYINNGEIFVDFVQADNFYPVRFDSAGKIAAAIFPEFKQSGKKLYTRLEYHSLENGIYTIINRAFVGRKTAVSVSNIRNLGTEIPLTDVQEWEDISPQEEFKHADGTLFSYFKVPAANNIDINSPLGVSVYARAVEQIRDTDEQYSAILWEYKSKETAIQASKDFFDKTRDGDVRLPNGKERFYHAMADVDTLDGKPFFNVYSPEIRDAAFFEGFNRMLRRVEYNCGLAYGTLSDLQTIERTATEIINSKQTTYVTVKDIQNAFEEFILEILHIMDIYCDMFKLAPAGTYDANIDFDDSLITDSNAERQKDREDLAIGAMQLWEYRMKWYGETEERAKAAVAESIQHNMRTELIP